MSYTTIQIKKETKEKLSKLKPYSGATYEEIIAGLIEIANGRNGRQYDEFLHRIQQGKMKELWDNKEDEAGFRIKPSYSKRLKKLRKGKIVETGTFEDFRKRYSPK